MLVQICRCTSGTTNVAAQFTEDLHKHNSTYKVVWVRRENDRTQEILPNFVQARHMALPLMPLRIF